MSNKPTFPAITLQRGATPSERTIADALQKLVGQSGSGLDRALTVRDFAKLQGFDVQRSGKVLQLGFDGGGTYAIPTKPAGVEILPTFNTVFLRWDEPDKTNVWYSLTEIWRIAVDPNNVTVPAFSNAVNILSVVGTMATDFVEPNRSYVYWIRHVNQAGVHGALHDFNGTLVKTLQTPEQVLKEYSAEVYQSENYQWLRSELQGLDAINRAYQAAGFGEGSELGNVLNGQKSATEFLAEQAMLEALDKYTQTQSIQAQANMSYARLSGGIHAAVGETEAYINRIQVLESKWANDLGNNISAQISLFDKALTSPTGAIATQINDIRVNFAGNASTLQEFSEAMASAEEVSANKIVALNSSLGETKGHVAGLVNQQTVLTNKQVSIASDLTSLSSTHGDTSASLELLAKTVADADGIYTAQWGVKTLVADLQGGVGFFNNGTFTSFIVDSNVFAVTGGSETLLPFIVKDNKVVMKTALIDTAEIYTLIAANVVAEKIKASISLESPTITGGDITGVTLDVNGNTVIDAQGYITGVGARFKNLTIVDNDDNTLFSSGKLQMSAVNGLTDGINAQVSTVVDSAFINDLFTNKIISASIYAEKIEGDVTDLFVKNTDAVDYTGRGNGSSKWFRLVSFTVAAQPFDRTFMVTSHALCRSYDDTESEYGSDDFSVRLFKDSVEVAASTWFGDSSPSAIPSQVATVEKNKTMTFHLEIKQHETNYDLHCNASTAVAQVFKNGSTLS